MEAVGLALGIASLYKATVDILSCLDAYQNFGTESQASLLRFKGAHIRPEDWANRVGIRAGKLADHHDSRLDDPRRASIIKDALACLGKVFSKVHDIVHKTAYEATISWDHHLGHILRRA